ncbi:RidA family protein [Microbacterium arabinogalactanolyticum]|uniref:RidA family protein n=1 Tax=Microbacterium arabinogalactanolyticum TaxID=69365 RepID=UPI00404442F3
MEHISTDQAPPPAGPYSQAIASGGLVFLAGQGPFNSEGLRTGESFEEQVRRTFENLEAVARAAGSSLSRAVRLGVYLRDLDQFAEFNHIARDYLTKPYPARTTIEVALRGFDIEIDAVVEAGAVVIDMN